MKATTTPIDGVLVLEPKVFGDARGFFCETFNARDFAAATGVDIAFVQDNHSRSSRGVLRGLHFQEAPYAQGKLVRVTHGSVFDVAVDVRPGSATFGHWFGVDLSAENHRQLWLPPGMAHGSSSPATRPISSTRRPATTRLRPSARSAGTTPSSASPGPHSAHRLRCRLATPPPRASPPGVTPKPPERASRAACAARTRRP